MHACMHVSIFTLSLNILQVEGKKKKKDQNLGEWSVPLGQQTTAMDQIRPTACFCKWKA